MVSIALALLGTNPSPVVQPALAKPGAAIEVVYDAESWTAGKAPLSPEVLRSIREQYERQNVPEEVIEESLQRHRKGEPAKTVKRTVRLTWREGVRKSEVLNTNDPMSKWISYTNGRVISERYSTEGKTSTQFSATTTFSTPSSIGLHDFPVLLGAITPEEFGQTARQPSKDSTTGEKVGTSVGALSVEPTTENLVGKLTVKFPNSERTHWTTEVNSWTKVKGVYVPQNLMSESFDGKGRLSTRRTLTLKQVTFGPSKDLSDLQGMGFKGERVSDCRFGTDNWVTYTNDGRLKSDEEVKKLLETRLSSGK